MLLTEPRPELWVGGAIVLWSVIVVFITFRKASKYNSPRHRKWQRQEKEERREAREKQKADFRLMREAYKRARRGGFSRTAALQFATDEAAAADRGEAKRELPPAGPQTQEPAARHALPVITAILMNAITIGGVFGLQWPVGTGLALYWSETTLTAIVMLALVAVWRYEQRDKRVPTDVSQLLGVSLIFNAAHFVFLLFFLAVILPRYATVERFDRHSFERGIVFVAAVMLLNFLINVVQIRKTTDAGLSLAVSSYMQRVGVLHLTIIFGMFGLAIFGAARAFFAVFAGLKMLTDLSRRL